MEEGGPRGDVLTRFAAADPWAPVSQEGLPPGLSHAIDTADWPTVKAKLAAVMDGLSTDGPYGRALLQAVQGLPIGVDPVFDRYRAAVAIDHADWDALRRCLEASPYNAHELEAFREAIHRSVNQLHGRPTVSPGAAPFIAYEFQFTARWAWYKQFARRLPSFDAESRFSRPDVPAGRHFRFRMLHHAVLMASGEAHAGRLPVATALAREARSMGDEGEPLRDMAVDIEVLSALAMGDGASSPSLRIAERTLEARGMSPLGTLEWLTHVMPFLSLMPDDWLTPASRLMQRIAGRFGSPKVQLLADSWAVAAQMGQMDDTPRRSNLPGVLTSAGRADVGLRVLPMLLSARSSRRYSEFQIAERFARGAGLVWAQVSALVWMVAIDPSPAVARRLARLLRVSGWRQPILVPRAVVADAALGMTTLGMRGQELVELSLASRQTATAADVAGRHASDTTLTRDLRMLGLEALARIGTSHARGILAGIGRGTDEVALGAKTLGGQRTGVAGLTDREIEVLNLAGHGLTNREIGERLFLSEHTVARHMSNARDKLGASNRADAAVKLGRMTASGEASRPFGGPTGIRSVSERGGS